MEEDNPFELFEVPRRVMHLFYLVDTSGSMTGIKIAALNAAVREALNEVGDIARENSHAQIKIAVLDYSTIVKWMYPQPMDSETFIWHDLEAGGLSNFGEALTELNRKLSRSHGFMTEPTGVRAPVFILLSDGAPSDDYKKPLEKIKDNPWFKAGLKLAIAIGDDVDTDVLAEFTGNSEAVLSAHSICQLKKLINFVSLSASGPASEYSFVGGKDGAAELADSNSRIVESITNAINTDPAMGGVDVGDSTANSGSDDWDYL